MPTTGPLGPVSLDRFRAAMATVPGPVTVITTFDQDRAHGTTVSAFCSLSAEPPLVLVALDRASDTLRYLQAHGAFGVNLLATGQEAIAKACAVKGPEKLDRVPWRPAGGLPRIDGAATWLACRVEQIAEGGDHLIVTGLVADVEVSDAVPMIYLAREMRAARQPQ